MPNPRHKRFADILDKTADAMVAPNPNKALEVIQMRQYLLMRILDAHIKQEPPCQS